MQCITAAEQKHLAEQTEGEPDSLANDSNATRQEGGAKTHISLAAG